MAKIDKGGETMELTIIICFLISVALNFLFSIWASLIAIKSYAKLLAQVIDTCAAEDKDKQFTEAWSKANR